MPAYYNEIDPPAAHILRALIAENVIAPGEVDTRSIKEVHPDDLIGFTQCHFFAGGGLWSVAARLAGWPDYEPLWTGSCPCQPFSAAGKGGGTDDPRHLWPDFYRLIRSRRPSVVMGEQVAGKAGYGWFDGVRADLEAEDFASRTVDFPACSVDAPHQRNRLYWIAMEHAARVGRGEGWPEDELRRGWPTPTGADARRALDYGIGAGLEGFGRDGDRSRRPEPGGSVAETDGPECRLLANGDGTRSTQDRRNVDEIGSISKTERGSEHDAFISGRGDDPKIRPVASAGRNGTYWSDAEWIACHDDKARRAKSGIRFLVDGLPGRVDLWRVGGNAIVPEAAAEVIAAFIDVYGLPTEWRAAA